jgi:pyruvate carboxylase subunit A
LNTHFIDLHKKGIDKEMENVIVEDTEIVNKLKSTFMPGKKIAAISAAVGSYQNMAKNQQMQKK